MVSVLRVRSRCRWILAAALYVGVSNRSLRLLFDAQLEQITAADRSLALPTPSVTLNTIAPQSSQAFLSRITQKELATEDDGEESVTGLGGGDSHADDDHVTSDASLSVSRLPTESRSTTASTFPTTTSPPTAAGSTSLPTFVDSSSLPTLPETTTNPTVTAIPTAEPTIAPTSAPFRFVATSPEQQAAIDAYRAKARLSYESKQEHCAARRRRRIKTAHVTACLNQTTWDLEPLVYPNDAEEHFHEIRQQMAPWAQHEEHKIHQAVGYAGPWIENQWIAHFEALYDDSGNETCLSDHFGPYIPIFLPWLDHWVGSRLFVYPPGFLDSLLLVLRPNVPYITVSQNDEGLQGRRNEFDHVDLLPNLLILSAGGYGHIPIPLLKQEEALHRRRPVTHRSIDLSYVGSLINAPYDLRQRMHDHLNRTAVSNPAALTYSYYYGDDWRTVAAESLFSLVPRGFGRTSYHVMEILQMGLVPVHVYLDIPWVPYADLWTEIAFDSSIADIETLLQQLQNVTLADIRARERRIVALRNSHFTMAGALSQIGHFMTNAKRSDLRCQALPESTRSL